MKNMDKKAFIARVEELLKEQIAALGEDPAAIPPQDYAAHMRCEVHNDGSMIYSWREMPVLRLVPEKTEKGTIYWRMFTPDERGSGLH